MDLRVSVNTVVKIINPTIFTVDDIDTEIDDIIRPKPCQTNLKTWGAYQAGCQLIKAINVCQNAFCFQNNKTLQLHQPLNNVFSWNFEDSVARHDEDFDWWKLLLLREGPKTLNANKTVHDFAQLAKYVKLILEEYFRNTVENKCVEITTSILQNSTFYDVLAMAAELKSGLELDLFRSIASNKFLLNASEYHLKRQLRQEQQMYDKIVDPIITRYMLSHQIGVETQYIHYYNLKSGNIQKEIDKILKLEKEYRFASRCTCNLYYIESETLRQHIHATEEKYRKAYDECEDKNHLLQTAIKQYDAKFKNAQSTLYSMQKQVEEVLRIQAEEEEARRKFLLERELAMQKRQERLARMKLKNENVMSDKSINSGTSKKSKTKKKTTKINK